MTLSSHLRFIETRLRVPGPLQDYGLCCLGRLHLWGKESYKFTGEEVILDS